MSPKQKPALVRGFTVTLGWVLVTVLADALCGFESLNTCGNQVLGELRCVFLVDVV